MKISHLKRLSAIAALLLCLTGTASAANSTGSGAAPSAEAKAALDKAIQEEEENAKKTPISVEEARKIVADNNLYQDIDLSAESPEQPLKTLSAIFSEMLHVPDVQLVPLEGREAKSESAIKTAYPIRWFRVVETHYAIRQSMEDKRQVITAQVFEVVHKKKATKSVAPDAIFFFYDAAGKPLSSMILSTVPEAQRDLSIVDVLNSGSLPQLKPGSREYKLAEFLYKTAKTADEAAASSKK